MNEIIICRILSLIIFILFLPFIINCSCTYDTNDNSYYSTDDSNTSIENGSEDNNEVFRDDFDGELIDTSKWQVATWSEHGGQTGPERCYTEEGFLKMIFVNDNGTYLGSAIQTKEEFLYGRWEALIKPSTVPGVLNSMFTIDWDDTTIPGDGDGTKQEIDIEFLTYTFDNNPSVHFAVHAAGFNSFNTNPDMELNFNPSLDFHVFGFEITPDHIEWFVDDTSLLVYYYSQNDITINAPYQLKLNVWSAVNWINGPPEPNVECVYHIDWIRFIPYEDQ